jgi:two-component system, sensor histidine kinase and response regulator
MNPKSQELICVHDLSGILLSVDALTAQTLGYQAEELVGSNLNELISLTDRPGFNQYLRRLETDRSNAGVLSVDHKNGEPRTWQYYNVRVDDPQRDPYVVLYAHDITEAKRGEETLTESAESFRLLVEGVYDYAILMLDANGLVSSWNSGAEKIKGYKAHEIMGRHFSCFYTAEDQQRKHPERELELAKLDGQYKEEGWRVRKDGSMFWATVLITALYDDSGQLRGFAKVTRDITEKKRMEEELLQARDAALESVRLKSEFLANMSHEIRTPMNGVIGMTGLLLDTELTEDQRDFAETIRQSGEALLSIINDILDFSKIEAGKLQFETLDFDLIATVEGAVEMLAERATAKQIELASLIRRDVPIALRGDPGRLRQVLTNLISNAIKFTARGEVIVRVEKESESAERVVLRFTVRDTGIGISEAAQQKLFQAFSQADGSTTRKFGGTGLGLAISKQLVGLMEGQIGVNSQPGEGATFWFTATFDKQLTESSSVINMAGLDGLRVLIVDDNATSRTILSHQVDAWGMLHEEAASATTALEILREAARQESPFDVAILDLMMPVMDGFDLARAIKSDETISATHLILLTSYGQPGHGAIAREVGIECHLTKPVRLSQLYNCLIEVMSRSSIATPVDLKQVSTLTLTDDGPLSDKLILVAEDNVVNQKVAVRHLRKLGYRADSVANGREAVEALSRIPYDLVLMDCQMPEMDGYEATEEIRRLEGPEKHTFIVALTAHALEGDRERCIAAGMDDYISKPIKPKDLERVLNSLLYPTEPQ